MSKRRMTSLDIIDTDAFLDLPQTSQNLYFHLNGRADDDGFVPNPNRISRMIGASGDDLKLLIGKKFIIGFQDGVCVIKHWRISNTIRKDRYKETKYLDHKQSLFIKGNGAYTLNEDSVCIAVPSGHFIVDDSLVDQTATVGRLKLSKVKLSKVNIKKETTPKKTTIKKKKFGEFENVLLSAVEWDKLNTKIGETNTNVFIVKLDGYIEATGKKYKSHYAVILNWTRKEVENHINKTKKAKVNLAAVGL